MAADFFNNHYGQLRGKTIVNIVKDGEFYGLVMDDGTCAWIQQDPEGNGPGFLDIQAPLRKKAA